MSCSEIGDPVIASVLVSLPNYDSLVRGIDEPVRSAVELYLDAVQSLPWHYLVQAQ